MDVIDHIINKKIQDGFFPADKLFYPDAVGQLHKIDFAFAAGEALLMLISNPDFFQMQFINLYVKNAEIRMLNDPNQYYGVVNTYLNTGYSFDSLLVETARDVCFLHSVVTELDEILWQGVSFYEALLAVSNEFQKKAVNEMMFAWIYLFLLVQKKEMQTGLTISISSACKKRKILETILGEWKRGIGKPLKKLTKEEIQLFTDLNYKRVEFERKIAEEINSMERVERETHDDWISFLGIVNDMSRQETNAIHSILSDTSAKDKLNVITTYQDMIKMTEKGQYILEGCEVDLNLIAHAALQRLIYSPYYSRAITKHGTSFIINPAIVDLVLKHRTFNYLFICYHCFRLSPSEDTANRFLSVALECIKKNFDQNLDNGNINSMYDMIEEFYSTVRLFVTDNKGTIDTLSFTHIQMDSVPANNILRNYETERKNELFKNELERNVSDALSDEKHLNRLLKEKPSSKKKLVSEMQEVEAKLLQIEEETNARQIIISLNIIYIFCDVLRIMLTNKNMHKKLRNPDRVAQYRIELRKIDHYLVEKVYSNMNKMEIGMLEYREKTGIEAKYLSEQEREVEVSRNNRYSEIIKDVIEGLVLGIEGKNVDQLLKTKSEIREEIFCYPSCDEKEQFAPWLDSISERICNALVEVLKHEETTFDEYTNAIRKGLGHESNRLPSSTINALTTAEMLYDKYTKVEYADKGFDYSCISALYYQAFEDAYNELIWHGYAEFLNTLVIDGQLFTDILKKCQQKGINIHGAKGYLDPDPKNRKYYVDYQSPKNPATKVKSRCMYFSFAIMMQSIKLNSPLCKFCDYFSQITGFANTVAMLSDEKFMEECKRFTQAVEDATDNRNNASHGGTIIDFRQCEQDKHTIIEELTKVRNDSVGLIQQLLFLLSRA